MRFQPGDSTPCHPPEKKSAFAFKDPLQQVALYW